MPRQFGFRFPATKPWQAIISLLSAGLSLGTTAEAVTITATPTISNPSPKTNDVLSITNSFTTSDGSTPTGVAYTYAWKKNGGSTLSTASTYNLATVGRGDKGDVITCTVTPNKSGYTAVAGTATATVINTAPVVKDINLYTIGNHKVLARPEYTDDDNDTISYSASGVDGAITFSGSSDGLFLWDPTTLDPTNGGTAVATVTLNDGSTSVNATATLHGDLVTGNPIYSGVGASDVQGKGASDYNNAKTDTSLANSYAPKIDAGLTVRLGAAYQLQRRAVNGFTTADALRSVSGNSLLSLTNSDAPGVITVWLGPNDALGLATTLAVTATGSRAAVVSAFDSTFTSNYTTLLNSLRSNNTSAKIVVGKVPPVGTLLASTGLLDADNISRVDNECLAMSNTIGSLAASNSASVVDLNADTDADLDGNGSNESALTAADISSDHFHPNDSGYTKLANRFLSKLDSIKPTVAVAAPADGSRVQRTSMTAGAINGTATDNVGVTGVSVQLTAVVGGTTMYWDGAGNFTTTPTSVAATVSTGTSVTWSLDNTPDVGLLSDQDYTVTATATDGLGNVSDPATSTFTVAEELNAPSLTISTPTSNQTLTTGTLDGTTITGTATDDAAVASVPVKLFRVRSGVKEYWNGTTFDTAAASVNADYSAGNWTLTNVPSTAQLDTGTYTIIATAVDTSGNESAAVTRNFKIADETTAPVATIASPTANQNVLAASLTAGFINGGATDNTAVASINVKLFRTRSGVKTYWNGSAWGSTSSNVPVDTTGLGTGSATWSISQVPSGSDLDTGAYSLQVIATDSAGNSNSPLARSFSITTDVTPPVASVTTPTPNQVLTPAAFAAMLVAGKVTDDTSVGDVTVKFYRNESGVKKFWNGSTFDTANVAAPVDLNAVSATQVNWNLTTQPPVEQLAAGSYSVQVTGKDTAGNTNTATCNFSLRDDVTPPTLTLLDPKANKAYTATELTSLGITGTATDASGIASVSIKLYRTISGGAKEYWNGSVFQSVSLSVLASYDAGTNSYSLDPMPTTAQLTAGSYGISVTAKDIPGNASAAINRSFSISGSGALRFSQSGETF